VHAVARPANAPLSAPGQRLALDPAGTGLAMNDSTRRYLVEGERAGLRYALGLPRQAPVGVAGTSLAQRAGSSLEFKDYREYQPGDDLRHIDWNAYGRTDQLFVKLYREEVTPHADVILDCSRSMALEGTAKPGAALGLAALFATAAANAGFSHAAWRLRDAFEPLPGDRNVLAAREGVDFV